MAKLKRGDVVDVVWHQDDPNCRYHWNGIAIVERVWDHNFENGVIYSVRLIHNGEDGGFHEQDLRLLGHIELPEADSAV